MGDLLQAFDRALDLIYGAALEPARWHEALVEASGLVGAGCFHLCGWNTETATDELGVIMSPHWQPALQSYVAHYAADDPRTRVMARVGDEQMVVCSEHFDERFVNRSALWQDHLIPWGLRYTMGATLGVQGATRVILGLMRDRAAGPFSAEEVAHGRRLLPHLRRACSLMLRTWEGADRQHLGAIALEHTHLGLLLLAGDGQLLHANGRAESLLRGQALLRLQSGRLRATDPQADARLQAAVKAVVAGAAPRHVMLRVPGGDTAWVTVMRPPADPAAMSPASRVLCLVAAGGRRLAPVEQLVEAFGLSPAEARVARDLTQGGTLDDCARAAGLSRNTVKSQLASVLAKMGLSNQRELIRLMAKLPAVRTHQD